MQGSEISRFPAGGFLISQAFVDPRTSKLRDIGIFGLLELDISQIAIFGDSSCLDPYISTYDCLWLLEDLLNFTSKGQAVAGNWFKLPYDYDIHVEEED